MAGFKTIFIFLALTGLNPFASRAVVALEEDKAGAPRLDWQLDEELEKERGAMAERGIAAYVEDEKKAFLEAIDGDRAQASRQAAVRVALGLFFQGDASAALSWIDKAGAGASDATAEETARVLNLKGLALLSQKRYDDAENIFQEAMIQGGEDRPYLLYNTALFYRHIRRKPKRALVYYRRFLDRAPPAHPAREAAFREADRLVGELGPEKEGPRLLTGRWKTGKAAGQTLSEYRGEDYLVQAKRKQRQTEAALQAGAAGPALRAGWEAGLLYLAGEDYERAAAILDRATRAYYSDAKLNGSEKRDAAQALNLYGVALAMTGLDPSRAEPFFMDASALDADWADPVFNLGYAAEKMGDKDIAREYYKEYDRLSVKDKRQ